MTQKRWLVHTVWVVVMVSLISCTPGRHVSRHAGAPTPPSPAAGKVAGLCEHLSRDRLLRKFVGKGDGEGFPTDEVISDDYSTCGFYERVRRPHRGHLSFHLRVWVPEPEDRSTPEVPPDVKDCPSGAACWLATPTACASVLATPADTDFRTFNSEGDLPPYEVKIYLGLWPDDMRDLCEADAWSKAQSVRLLKEALKYLAAS